MASKQTYECYVCKRNGFADVRVYLDGRTEDGKAINKNPDMTSHVHRQGQQVQSTANTKDDTSSTNALLKIIIAELQRLIKLFEEQQQTKDNYSKDRHTPP